MWPFDCKNVVAQHNKFMNAHGPMDSMDHILTMEMKMLYFSTTIVVIMKEDLLRF